VLGSSSVRKTLYLINDRLSDFRAERRGVHRLRAARPGQLLSEHCAGDGQTRDTRSDEELRAVGRTRWSYCSETLTERESFEAQPWRAGEQPLGPLQHYNRPTRRHFDVG